MSSILLVLLDVFFIRVFITVFPLVLPRGHSGVVQVVTLPALEQVKCTLLVPASELETASFHPVPFYLLVVMMVTPGRELPSSGGEPSIFCSMLSYVLCFLFCIMLSIMSTYRRLSMPLAPPIMNLSTRFHIHYLPRIANRQYSMVPSIGTCLISIPDQTCSWSPHNFLSAVDQTHG